MNETVSATLKGMAFADVQAFQNLAVFPILVGEASGPEYMTLPAALKKDMLEVKEVSEDGSVPEVKVLNKAEIPVLLLDGEELVGAKQNRVVNSSVLLKAKFEAIVNVSCTERGRWAYATESFGDSGVVMARSIRARKSSSVSDSLRTFSVPRSDQGEIWDEIDMLSESAHVSSRTDAMRDVYMAKHQELEECLKAFPKVEGQCGLVFLVDRAVVGMDMVSRPEAYSELHDKLIKSYVIDSTRTEVEGQAPPSIEAVTQFIKQTADCSESSFESVGHGIDYRFEHSELCGSALVHEQACIHVAFFSNVALEDGPRMSGFRQRRRFRQSGKGGHLDDSHDR